MNVPVAASLRVVPNPSPDRNPEASLTVRYKVLPVRNPIIVPAEKRVARMV